MPKYSKATSCTKAAKSLAKMRDKTEGGWGGKRMAKGCKAAVKAGVRPSKSHHK